MNRALCLLALAALLSACTSQVFQPDISDIAKQPQASSRLPSNADLWQYTAITMANFMKRVDLDAGVDFGGNVADAGISAAAGFVGIAARGASPIVGYLAGAEGLFRRLLSIANPVVRGNALSGGVRQLRMCRIEFLKDLQVETPGAIEISGARLTPAGVKFFACIEASINGVIALLQGSWPSLPETILSTPMAVAPQADGSLKVQPVQPQAAPANKPAPLAPAPQKETDAKADAAPAPAASK